MEYFTYGEDIVNQLIDRNIFVNNKLQHLSAEIFNIERSYHVVELVETFTEISRINNIMSLF